MGGSLLSAHAAYDRASQNTCVGRQEATQGLRLMFATVHDSAAMTPLGEPTSPAGQQMFTGLTNGLGAMWTAKGSRLSNTTA